MELLNAFFDSPGDMIALGVAVMTFATVMTLAAPMFKGDQLETRMKLVASRRDELRRASRAQITARDSLRHAEGGVTKRVVERLQLSRLLEDPKLVDNLAQAGFRGPKPLQVFYFFRFVTPFVLAALAGLYITAINPHLKPMTRLMVRGGGLSPSASTGPTSS